MARFVTLLFLHYTFNVVPAQDSDRRCLLFRGACVLTCPRNMHPYHTRCNGETMSQRTCEHPFVYTIGYTCGWSRCDCNGNYVLDEETSLCVEENKCPLYPYRKRKPKNPNKDQRRKDRRKYHRSSKRIHLPEEERTDVL